MSRVGKLPVPVPSDVIVVVADAIETVKGASYPEVLRRRGVVHSARSRSAAHSSMDVHDHRALDDILRDLEPLFTWQGGGPVLYGESNWGLSGTPDGGSIAQSGEADDVAPVDRVG